MIDVGGNDKIFPFLDWFILQLYLLVLYVAAESKIRVRLFVYAYRR